jgi:hypothetical protein
MSNSGMYIDYLEGNLDSKSELEFANKFAIDEDFRDGFKSYILITSAISSNIKAFGPSMNETSEIYKKLGYTIPAGMLPTIAVPPSKPSFFQGSALNNILLVVGTAIATIIIMSVIGSTNQFNNNQNQPIAKTNAPNSLDTKQIIGSRDKTSTSKTKQTTNVVIGNQKPLLDTAQNTIGSNQLVANDYQKDQIVSVSESPQSKTQSDEQITAHSQIHSNNISSSKYDTKFQFPLYDTCMFIRSYDTRFRFEFKNTPSWFTNTAIIQPFQLNKFNNLSVSLFYPIYKTLILGADFRQETFYLEYTGTNNQDQHLRYYQQPNLSTFGLSFRYTPFDLSEHFKPFGQLLIGANKYGFITREMIGLEYYPFEYVYFLFGAELNQFYFSHNSNWFNASKYSLNYGIGVKF